MHFVCPNHVVNTKLYIYVFINNIFENDVQHLQKLIYTVCIFSEDITFICTIFRNG